MLGPAHTSLGLLGGTVSALAMNSLVFSSSASPFVERPLASLGAIIVGGGFGLFSDVDSRGTLTRTLGVLGTALNKIALGLSSFMWNLTATKRDTLGKGGYHRTFTHTLVFVVLVALGVGASVRITGDVGEALAIIYSGLCLTIVGAGLYGPRYKKHRSLWGPYVLLGAGVGVTALVLIYGRRFDPSLADQEAIAWMFGLSALLGGLSHAVIGDGITRQGTPMLWPIKIRGRRWYNLHLFGFRLEASSKTANTVIQVVSHTLILALIGTSLYLHFSGQTWGGLWNSLLS